MDHPDLYPILIVLGVLALVYAAFWALAMGVLGRCEKCGSRKTYTKLDSSPDRSLGMAKVHEYEIRHCFGCGEDTIIGKEEITKSF